MADIQIPEEEYRKQLERLGIYDLRQIGREKHVKSPTSLKSGALVNAILDVEYGRTAPHFSKYGRPPKATVKRADDHSFRGGRKQRAGATDWYRSGSIMSSGSAVVIPATAADSGARPSPEGAKEYTGLLEFAPGNGGFGFIRPWKADTFTGVPDADVYVSAEEVKKYGLKSGDRVRCLASMGEDSNIPLLCDVISVNDRNPDEILQRKDFEEIALCAPESRIVLEREGEENDPAMRLTDLFAPLAKGQRGLIAAPHGAGATEYLKSLCRAVTKKKTGMRVFCLLVGARPEEIAAFRRSSGAVVVASAFDAPFDVTVRTAEMLFDHCKRLAECGEDVAIFIDSLMGLVRAYNAVSASQGKTFTTGLDAAALAGVKHMLAAARELEAPGSLTVIGTVVENGSRVENAVAEELLSTANWTVRLSGEMARRRVFPAMDVAASYAKQETELLSEEEKRAADKMRRAIADGADESVLSELVRKTSCNRELLDKYELWMNGLKENR